MNAVQLIARSEFHNEIAHSKWSERLWVDLISRSEDSVEANGTVEIWGTTEDGDEWRVHLAKDGAQ